MKKIYQAPTLEIEVYRLDASIASNCTIVVDMGPEGVGAIKVCDSYYEAANEGGSITFSVRSMPVNVDFWTGCDCYYSASGKFFTS